MAYAAVAFLWDTLQDLLTNHQVLLIHGSEQEDVLELKSELSRLKLELEKLAFAKERKMLDGEIETDDNDGQELEMDREVITAVYQVEDIIDSVIITRRRRSISKISTSNEGCCIIPRSVPTASSNSTTTPLQIKSFTQDTLKPLITKLQAKTTLLPIVAPHEYHTNLPSRTPRVTTPKPATQEYVGNKACLSQLMNMMTEEYDSLEVICITGMGGIGKTTMARRIFRDPRINHEFPILIWVNSPQVFDMRSVYLTIFKSFTSRDMSSKVVDELRVLVSRYLRMVKFFLVIDDLLSLEAWDDLKLALPMENRKSKVLITSGLIKLSYEVNPSRGPVPLDLLTDEESWRLLQLRVFGDLHRCPPNFEMVGKSIAEYCKGLPLGIVIIGGFLLKKMSRITLQSSVVLQKEWEGVHRIMPGLHEISDVLLRSIQITILAMPDYLKNCLFYIGMFPKNTKIPIWKVTQLWIAEGFIIHKQGQSLEETAKEYLNELITKSVLMVDKIDIYDEVKTFQVHDSIRDLCMYDAYKQNLFTCIRRHDKRDLNQYRRLCIHHDEPLFLAKKPRSLMSRTLLFLTSSPTVLDNEDDFTLFKDFSFVRVLEANSIKLPQFPTEITQLFHLRYITLSCDELKVLPESISNLWNLQTLVVNTLSPTLEVKVDIWKLMHLRFLKTKASMSLTKREGNGCRNLHTVTQLSPQSFTSDVPNKAKNLKELGIRGMLSDSLSFEKLNSLEKLKLQHDVFPRKQSDYPIARLPETNMFPPNLKFLVLSGTYLDWKHISVVGNLHTLEALKLKDNAFKGPMWEVADGSFRHLEALSITEAELKYWTAQSGSFPKLKNLEIKNCKKLLEVPLALGETLERLYMSCVTRYAVSCAEKIEQDRTTKAAEFKLEVHHVRTSTLSNFCQIWGW